MAARNVLLTYDLKAKVADFGLSSRIYVETDTRKGGNSNIIPFRWAAYEVLQSGPAIKEFSDIWSFGVLMWEIFHLGSAVPYGDKKEYGEVILFLKSQHRLSQPPLCPQYVYDLMFECWTENYNRRPTFLQLKTKLCDFNPSKHLSYPKSVLFSPLMGQENVMYTDCNVRQ